MKSSNPIVVIPGGGGFLGRHVATFMSGRGWEVIVLSRRADVTISGAKVLRWDGRTIGPWASAIDGADVVLNLAGRSVNCRYNRKNRLEIEQSRVLSTRVLGEAIARARNKPRVWLNSSTATIYRHAEDRPQDEFTGEIGSGFSVDVATAWEKEFFEPVVPGVRKIAMRSAMVMGPEGGGPYSVFRNLVHLRLGGRMGDGRQFVSWVHIEDFCRAIEFLIQHEEMAGCINIVSPNALRNTDFMRVLRDAEGVRLGLPAARWMLEIGAFFLRTETELPLRSRWVTPTRLLKAGFEFKYPNWPGAAHALRAGSGDDYTPNLNSTPRLEKS